MARALKEKLLPKNQRQKSKASPPEDRYFTFTPDDARGTWAAAPRRSTLSKLRDSFRLVKDRSKTGLDPPRFSCDGISEFKLKEPPRRSLDGRILLGTSDPPDDPPSYEPPRRSFDVGMLSKTYQNSQQQQQQQQRTNVVARLMGLSDTHLDGPCRKLEDFFKDELAVLGPGVKTDSSPERSQQQQQQQQKSQNFPKAKQDVISTMQQQASFQKVVERLERLQISESLKQQQHVSRSSLMRPTIASSARGQRHQRHRIVGAAPGTPKPSETPAKNKKISNEWSPRRDQSESRAALLTLRERKKREVAAAAAVSSRVDSDGGDLGNVTISQESCEKSFRQYDPGTETSTAAAPGSDLRSSTKPSVDAFENWSPVSVLERPVSYEDEDEDLHHCDVAAAVKPSPDQQVRNVEPDKFRDASKISQPDKPAMIRKQPLPELPSLGVFKAPFFSAFDDEHDSSMHVCVDHWSHHHHRHHRQQCCAKCLAQVCIQVDTAIFDDLVYDSIIQLNAQHITKWMRMSMLS